MVLITPVISLSLLIGCGSQKGDTGNTLLAPPSEPTEDPEEEVPEGQDTGLESWHLRKYWRGHYIDWWNSWDLNAQFYVSQYDNELDFAIAQNDVNNQQHPNDGASLNGYSMEEALFYIAKVPRMHRPKKML